MTISTHERDGEVTINIDGRFVFACHRDFNTIMDKHSGMDLRYIVDLSKATYLDSAALGMLLTLRDHVGNDANRVLLRKPSAEVKNLLEYANFRRMFAIE